MGTARRSGGAGGLSHSADAAYITRQVISVNGGMVVKRVVVTGVGALSPLGHDWPAVLARLRSWRNVVRVMDDWDEYEGPNTRLGAPALPSTCRPHYNRKSMRSMGRVALMATRASELALADAGCWAMPLVQRSWASPTARRQARPPAIGDFGRMIIDKTPKASPPTPTSR